MSKVFLLEALREKNLFASMSQLPEATCIPGLTDPGSTQHLQISLPTTSCPTLPAIRAHMTTLNPGSSVSLHIFSSHPERPFCNFEEEDTELSHALWPFQLLGGPGDEGRMTSVWKRAAPGLGRGPRAKGMDSE